MNKAQIEHLINKIFKILPLAEEGNVMKAVCGEKIGTIVR